MEIIFKSKDREYKATVHSIEEIYEAVHDATIAMGYHKNTAKTLIEELKEDDE